MLLLLKTICISAPTLRLAFVVDLLVVYRHTVLHLFITILEKMKELKGTGSCLAIFIIIIIIILLFLLLLLYFIDSLRLYSLN